MQNTMHFQSVGNIDNSITGTYYGESSATNNNNNNRQFFKLRIAQLPPTSKTSEQSSSQTISTTETTPAKKPMKWGEPTWIFFHTLAEKVDATHFTKIRVELLNTIYSICANLPCPVCSVHATEYLNSTNFNNIQTKQQFKDFMFQFHNVVNNRKGYALYNYVDLDPKYSRANTINIIHNFFGYYQDRSPGIHMIANDMYRQNLVKKIKQWFNANIQYFEH